MNRYEERSAHTNAVEDDRAIGATASGDCWRIRKLQAHARQSIREESRQKEQWFALCFAIQTLSSLYGLAWSEGCGTFDQSIRRVTVRLKYP